MVKMHTLFLHTCFVFERICVVTKGSMHFSVHHFVDALFFTPLSKSLIWRIRAMQERSKSLIWVTPLQRLIQILDLVNKSYWAAFQIFDLSNTTAKCHTSYPWLLSHKLGKSATRRIFSCRVFIFPFSG